MRRVTRVGGDARAPSHKIFGGAGMSRIPSVNGLVTCWPRPLSPMTPVGLLSQSVALVPNEASPRREKLAIPTRADGLIYPCPRCGGIVRARTALRVDDLPYVGWTPHRVVTYVNWCGHEQAAIPWPQPNGSVRLIPSCSAVTLMPGVYVDFRDFVAEHRVCGRPTGDVDSLESHGYRVWARCPCGARFERWVAADGAEADILRSALDDSRCLDSQTR